MGKKEREIWELEMNFKNFFLLYHILHGKFCRRKWVINLSFRSRENLFLIFELFQFDKCYYFLEGIF